MSKHLEKSRFVNQLPKDDPECAYVNSMLEISIEFLKSICKSGDNFNKLHGVVPKSKLPNGYDFGRNKTTNTKSTNCDYKDTKNHTINQKSTNPSKIDSNQSSVDKRKATSIIDNVTQDLKLSNDNEDYNDNLKDNRKVFETLNKCSSKIPKVESLNVFRKHYNNNKCDQNIVGNSQNNVTRDLKLSSDDEDYNDNLKDNGKIFETLNKCSSKIPKVESLNVFRKHYSNNKCDQNIVENSQNKYIAFIKRCLNLNPKPILSKKEPPDDASCTGDTEPFEDSNESAKHNPQEVMKLIELLNSSKPEVKVSAFEPVYNEIIRKRKALKVAKDEYAPPTKKSIHITADANDILQMAMPISKSAEEQKDVQLNKMFDFYKNQLNKHNSKLSNSTRPSYVSQESLPFSKSDISIKKENKTNEKNVGQPNQQLFGNSALTDDLNGIKKPQATAKQIFPQSTNYSNYHSNNRFAVVTGINKTSSNSNTTTPSIPFQSNQQTNPKLLSSKSSNQRIANANVNEEDEQKVVEGLMAIEKLRTNVKNEYMNRMRNLDTEAWLRDADGHKQNAEKKKGTLDYAHMIILAAKKYLIYNYSLDVKEQNKKCHETYLHNADFMQNIGLNLNQIYKSLLLKITDQNSSRYWNLDLIRWFSIAMCMKLRAILQYRAYRNVATYCKDLYNVLINHGVIDNDGRTNALLAETNQSISPFSVLSSYSPGRNSTRNSSPRVTPLNNRNNANTNSLVSSSISLTAEMRSQLQKYIDKTKIVNNSYYDWTQAEIHTAKFCKKSQRHEEAWKEIEWKIIEKTGGITINGIDESMPFVIKYLDGFCSYICEFQKYLNSPLDPT